MDKSRRLVSEPVVVRYDDATLGTTIVNETAAGKTLTTARIKASSGKTPSSGDGRTAVIDKRSMPASLPDVYHRLRQDILSGELEPGDILNQVHIAKRYGVSRTPIREALRMLQAENLVDAQFQHRTRVTNVTSDEVDSVYATWILMQSLGIALTVPVLSKSEFAQFRQTLQSMNTNSPLRKGNEDQWENLHRDFHNIMVIHAGSIINASIDNCWSRSERARRLLARYAPQSWLASEAEHEEIVAAYEKGSVTQAIHAASHQLARNGLAVIAGIDPSYEPRAIRQALKLALPAAIKKDARAKQANKTS